MSLVSYSSLFNVAAHYLYCGKRLGALGKLLNLEAHAQVLEPQIVVSLFQLLVLVYQGYVFLLKCELHFVVVVHNRLCYYRKLGLSQACARHSPLRLRRVSIFMLPANRSNKQSAVPVLSQGFSRHGPQRRVELSVKGYDR